MRVVKSILINEKKEFRLVEGSNCCFRSYYKLPKMSTKVDHLGKKPISSVISSLKSLDNKIPQQPQQFFQYCQEVYGKRVWERFNKLMYKEWVVPVKPFSGIAYNIHKGDYDSQILKLLHNNLNPLLAIKQDGLMNIYPLVAATGLTPDALKVLFGKGTWKSLCANSKTRNELLVRITLTIGLHSDHIKPLITKLNTIPSTLLKRGILCYDWQTLLPKFKTLRNFDKVDINRYYQIKTDTIRMASILGKTTNEKWSYARWEAEHEHFTEEVNRLKYSDEIYPYLVGKGVIHEITSTQYDDLTATILKSPLEMHTEGSVMRHCLGGYHNTVNEQDKCLFYSITQNGKRVSSLQLKVNDRGYIPHVIKAQHYGFANSIIKDPRVLAFSDIVQSFVTSAFIKEFK